MLSEKRGADDSGLCLSLKFSVLVQIWKCISLSMLGLIIMIRYGHCVCVCDQVWSDLIIVIHYGLIFSSQSGIVWSYSSDQMWCNLLVMVRYSLMLWLLSGMMQSYHCGQVWWDLTIVIRHLILSVGIDTICSCCDHVWLCAFSHIQMNLSDIALFSDICILMCRCKSRFVHSSEISGGKNPVSEWTVTWVFWKWCMYIFCFMWKMAVTEPDLLLNSWCI